MARNSKHDLSDDEGSSPDPYDLALASAPKRARVESSSAPQPTASTSKSKDAMQVDADESEEEIDDVEDEEEDRRVEEGVETMRKSVKKKGVRPRSPLCCATSFSLRGICCAQTVAQSAVIEQVDMQNFMVRPDATWSTIHATGADSSLVHSATSWSPSALDLRSTSWSERTDLASRPS
jgi:hypothetical protein